MLLYAAETPVPERFGDVERHPFRAPLLSRNGARRLDRSPFWGVTLCPYVNKILYSCSYRY